MYTFLLVIMAYFIIPWQIAAMEKPKPEASGFQRGMAQAPVVEAKVRPYSKCEIETFNSATLYINTKLGKKAKRAAEKAIETLAVRDSSRDSSLIQHMNEEVDESLITTPLTDFLSANNNSNTRPASSGSNSNSKKTSRVAKNLFPD